MAKRRWHFRLEDGSHSVELEHAYFLGTRRMTVDGYTFVQRGRPFGDHSGSYHFRIGSRDAVLRITTNGFTYSYDVLVDGRSVSGGARPARPLGGPRPALVLAAIFLIVGIGFLPLFVPYAVAEYRLATEGAVTTGTMVRRSTEQGKYGANYYFEYSFLVPGRGETFEGRDQVSEGMYRGARPGDRHPVLYVPSDPSISSIPSSADLWSILGVLFALGLEALWLGLGLFLFVPALRKMRTRKALASRGVEVSGSVVRHREDFVQGYGMVISLEYAYHDEEGAEHRGKTVNLFHDEAAIYPAGSRIRVLFDPRSPGESAWLEELETA